MLLPLLAADCGQQVRDTAHLFRAPVRQLAASSAHHHWAPETAGHNSGVLRTCLLVDGSTRL